MKYTYDVLAIGDTVTDAFIRLKEASVHCTIDHEKCEICMRFKDKIPYEDVYVIPAVGNSANAAVAAARLGLTSALVSDIGDDYFGQECLNALRGETVSTDFIQIHQGRKTNYHYVLWYEDDRTILVKHEEYPYALPDFNDPSWVYLSSLGSNSLAYHNRIEQYLETHPSVRLAFQPGTYQIKFGKEALAGIYRRSEILFCNKEESQRILSTPEEDMKKLLRGIADLGPRMVVITDGREGAYAYDASRGSPETVWQMPIYPDPKPPYERTGAGDAFSSTVTAALALGFDLKEALGWGPVNSMSVVQQVGARAGLLTRAQLEEYLKNAPSGYGAKKIS